jgi:pectate lyase-like protein
MALQTINIGASPNDGSGDPLRTAMDKINDNFGVAGTGRYDVTHPDYGAIGNGVFDCTTAIQSAIDDCHDAGGGEVYFPAGTYLVGASALGETFSNYGTPVSSATGCIILRKSVKLKGAGVGQTKILSSSPSLTVIFPIAAEDIEICDLEINWLQVFLIAATC